MRFAVAFSCVVVVSALSSGDSPVLAQQAAPRQYYTNWSPMPGTPNVWYSTYNFKPNANDPKYSTQIVIYTKARPDEVFFRNTKDIYTPGPYWCSAPTNPKLRGSWHVFSDDEKKDRITKLGGTLDFDDADPPIPNSRDGATMISPLPLPKR